MKAAEEANSPVIIGINSGILTSKERIIPPQDMKYMGAICKIAKENAKVPVLTILNESGHHRKGNRGN